MAIPTAAAAAAAADAATQKDGLGATTAPVAQRRVARPRDRPVEPDPERRVANGDADRGNAGAGAQASTLAGRVV